MNTNEGDLPNKKVFTIDNTNLEPEDVAKMIKKYIS
jgi:hypothetical protein